MCAILNAYPVLVATHEAMVSHDQVWPGIVVFAEYGVIENRPPKNGVIARRPCVAKISVNNRLAPIPPSHNLARKVEVHEVVSLYA
jgi:hypothetical protein